MNLYDKVPAIAHDSWVAPNASVIGNVEICNDASVWYGCVLRGDLNKISIGNRTNIQDRTVIHTSSTTSPGLDAGTSIGNDVTVGHACVLYSCTIENNCLIGMGSIVLDGALVESNSILAAGTVVPPGRRIPSGQVRYRPIHQYHVDSSYILHLLDASVVMGWQSRKIRS